MAEASRSAIEAGDRTAPGYVAWLDLGEGEWVRAFETDDPADAFFRAVREAQQAGARQAQLLPAGCHPSDEPDPVAPDPFAQAAPSVGWLFVAGDWERACADDDFLRCVQRTQDLAGERDALRWQVLPEGRDPKEKER